ncbi:MAG: SDR family NAD(P)-dependent oxidoreductase, partial [Planctomycetota bacterium]|nr:SDR family NAD(P)-dependent oxidoreductase [Planctomycetota bacterium]
MDLKGSKAVVTGASSGIGEAIALELAARGVCLTLTARRGDRLEELGSRITAAGGEAPLLVV